MKKIPTFAKLPTTFDELTRQFPPRPIRNNADHDKAMRLVGVLAVRNLGKDQADYLEVLTLLLERHDIETAPKSVKENRSHEVRIWYSAEPGDDCFVAQVLTMPGIMAHGDTREAAAREIQVALDGALEVLRESKTDVPKSGRRETRGRGQSR